MSFSITVHLPYGQEPYPTDPQEQDAWYEEYLAHLILDRPFGTDSMINVYWHLPSLSLGLRLVPLIYNDGLKLKEPQDLLLLQEEIKLIANYWQDNLFDSMALEVKEDLLIRMDFLHQAVKLALNENGILNVS